MMNTRKRDNVCPYCGKVCDLVSTPVHGRGPREGDFTVCVDCGTLGIFDSSATGGLRLLNEEEAAEASQHPLLQAMMSALKKTIAEKRVLN